MSKGDHGRSKEHGRRNEGEESPRDNFPVTIKKLWDVKQVLELARQGMSKQDIARELGCRAQNINNFMRPVERLLDYALLYDPQDPMRDIPEAKRFILAAEKLRQCYNDLLFPKRFGASRVTAGAYPSVLASFLPRVFAELPELSPLKKGGLKGFVEQFPNVSVHLTSGEGMQLLQQVHDETLDCAIVDEGLTDFYAQSLTYERLFSSKPIGFLYRADNREMVQHASRPAEFSFNCMATQTVFLIDEDHPLYRAWKGLLVAPRPGVGTWVYLRTFSQVRAAIAAVKNGVGLGIPLDSDEQEGIKHFDFSGLVGNDDRIRTLRQYRINHFALYLRCNWKESPANGGLSLPAKGLVACMRAAVTDADGVRYTHPYLA